MSNKWNKSGANPLADLERMANELAVETGIEPYKKWEEMTPEERKTAVAAGIHGYAQHMYLMGYTGGEVVAILKMLRKAIIAELGGPGE